MPGYAFAYSFDDIGNRTQTVVNERIASYSSDALNRYIQRDHPGAVDVRGSAPEQVGVIINSDRTERTGEAFYAPGFGDNSTASVELDIVVKALDPAAHPRNSPKRAGRLCSRRTRKASPMIWTATSPKTVSGSTNGMERTA